MGLATCFSILPIIGFILYLLLGRQIQRNRIFKLKKDRKGLAMIVDEQIEALESDDFSKGNHQIVKFKEMVRMLLLTMLHSLLLIIKPRFILMAMQNLMHY